MLKWIYTKQIPFTQLPGGVFALGDFSILNSQDQYGNWRTDFTCIVESSGDEFAVRLECEKEYIRSTVIASYLIGTGIVQSRGDILDGVKIEHLNKASTADFKNIEYLLLSINQPTEPNENSFIERANQLYAKLRIADIYVLQAGQYLNTAYALFDNHKECITNFNKVLESISIGVSGNKKNYKLAGKNLHRLAAKLNLSDDEKAVIVDLNKTRNEIGSHGVIDPELEYIFNQYDPNGVLSKYFVVTCGPGFGLGDKIMIFEPIVRKCFAIYLGIEYIERPLFR